MRQSLVLMLGLALWACPARVQYPECKTDGDCADHGQVCANGFCRQCRDDSGCPSGKTCTDGICVAKSECPCAAGLKCVADKCVPECTPDTVAQDCGEGRECVQGRCAAVETCTTDADCGGGRPCVAGRCGASGLPASNPTRLLGDCNVRAVYFGFDDAALSREARRTLDEDWQCLSRAQLRRVVVAGHTDERGTTEYNLALGMRRADVVKKYLSDLGAESKKLKSVSYGKERPAERGHDERAWSRNRRVELAPEVVTQ